MTAQQFPIYPDLKDRVADITGIGQVGVPDSPTWGNGAATARVLSHNGVEIFGCHLNLQAAEYTKQRLLADSRNSVCDVMEADMTSLQDIENLVEAVMTKYGRIDILYNNVGMTAPGDPGSISEELWQKQIDLNLNCSGSIVNNASITAMRYIEKPQIAYATAKAAVIQYTKVNGIPLK